MSSGSTWLLLFIAAAFWAGSCWYFYSIGRLHGNTEANIKAAQHFRI